MHSTYQQVYTWRKTFLYCVLVWVISWLFEIPNWVRWGGHTFDLKNMYCFYDRLRDVSYTYFLTCLGICVPVIAVCISYTKIFMYVYSVRKEVYKISGSRSVNQMKSRQKEEIQLAKTFCTLCIVFVACLSPYAFVMLVDYEDKWSKIIYVLTVEISHLNNSINFILYGAMNRRFRSGYRYCFNLIWPCQTQNGERSVSSKNYIGVSSKNGNLDQTASSCVK